MWEYAYYSGLLDRKFGASAPLEKLVTDVTEMRVLGGGRLYRCREYLRFAREHGVVRSMSRRGSCYDNAVIESHFGNLKGRLGRLDRVPADKAAEMIDEAVRYFNEERILLKLGGLSPAEFLREYEKRQERGRKSAADI